MTTTNIFARSLANFLSSVSRQTHEFIIYAMWQQVRADNLTVCYRKKQMDVSSRSPLFRSAHTGTLPTQAICPVIDNEFCHIVKIVCGSTATLTML